MTIDAWSRGLLGLVLCGVGCNGAGDDGDVWNSGTEGPTSSGDAADDPSADETTASTVGATGGSADEDSSGDDGPKLDVGSPGGGFDGCGCELAYIWVANSAEGTVSKINTSTMIEEGRYLTRPDGSGDPSRTSVNLAGDVAVANRFGGLVKIRADASSCVESNGMPGIQTSTGPGDVLPWDVEECRSWYVAFPTSNQRPVAWTGGTAGPDGNCSAQGAQVWTVMSTVPGLFPGLGGPGGVTATLLDGDSGAIVEQVEIPQEVFSGGQFGAYGGAVDAQGNLYFVGLGGFGGGLLARVRKADLAVSTWPIPAGVSTYGITVDHEGNPWVSSTLGAGAARFHPDTETWDVVMGFWGGSGLAEGPDDRMFVSGGGGVYAVDLETLAVDHVFVSDETVKGVGFDVDSNLWAVTYQDTEMPTPEGGVAFKIDPVTGVVIDFYNGLDHPYTYSDMTGKALGTVTCPPAG